MGSLRGHLLPGTMFIIVSFWWFIGEILRKVHRNLYSDSARGAYSTRAHDYLRSKTTSKPVWYACGGARLSKLPVEPIVKIAIAVVGVIAELPGSKAASLFDENGEFAAKHLDNYAHSVMYGFFGLSGVVDLVMWYALLPLPPKFDYLVMSMFFWFEGFLFFFHLHGRDELNVRLHTILYILVFVTAIVFFIAVISDQFFNLMGFLKAYLLSLQGSWFYQVGFVLFGPNPWKNSPSNVECLGIVFAFHAMTWFVVHLFCHIVCYRCYIKKHQPSERLFVESSGEEDDCLTLEEL